MSTDPALDCNDPSTERPKQQPEPARESGPPPASSSTFDLGEVERGLAADTAAAIFRGGFHHFQTTPSTQTLAIKAAHAGAPAGQVYLADEQTAGRGRGGHTWHSAADAGLYLTTLLRPTLRGEHALGVSFAAGLAAQAALFHTTGFRIDLRWPNDLVTPGPGSRKLGGILTESAMHPDGSLRYAAVGIGINLNQPAMPPALQGEATSLQMLTGAHTRREPLLLSLLHHLALFLRMLEEEPAALHRSFAKASTWVLGKRVAVAEDDGYTGVTAGLTGAGLLRVHGDDGREHIVRHGGVRERT